MRRTLYTTYVSWWRRRWNGERATAELPETPSLGPDLEAAPRPAHRAGVAPARPARGAGAALLRGPDRAGDRRGPRVQRRDRQEPGRPGHGHAALLPHPATRGGPMTDEQRLSEAFEHLVPQPPARPERSAAVTRRVRRTRQRRAATVVVGAALAVAAAVTAPTVLGSDDPPPRVEVATAEPTCAGPARGPSDGTLPAGATAVRLCPGKGTPFQPPDDVLTSGVDAARRPRQQPARAGCRRTLHRGPWSWLPTRVRLPRRLDIGRGGRALRLPRAQGRTRRPLPPGGAVRALHRAAPRAARDPRPPGRVRRRPDLRGTSTCPRWPGRAR